MKKGIFWAGVETDYGVTAGSFWPFPFTLWDAQDHNEIGSRGGPVNLTASFPFMWTPKFRDMLGMAIGEDGVRRNSYTLRRAYKWGHEEIVGAVPVSYSITGSAYSGDTLLITVSFIGKTRTLSNTPLTTPSSADLAWDHLAQCRHARLVMFDDSSVGLPVNPHDFTVTVEDPNVLVGPTDWDGGVAYVDSRTRWLSFDATTDIEAGVFTGLQNKNVRRFMLVIAPGLSPDLYYGGAPKPDPPFPVIAAVAPGNISIGDSFVIRSIAAPLSGYAEGAFTWGGMVSAKIFVPPNLYGITLVNRAGDEICGYGTDQYWSWQKDAVMISVDRIKAYGGVIDGEMGPDRLQVSGAMEPDAVVSTVY